jgi:aminoacyl tRNA synthase complex-interacting multifunctional protein 1
MLISNIYPLATLLLSSSALVLFSSVTIITTTTAFVVVVPTSSSRQYSTTTKSTTTTFLVNESSEIEPEPVAAVVVATSESEEKPKPKKKKKKPPQQPAEPIEIDISKLDIRVGVIEKAWEHVEADKLYCEEINIGEEEPRNIASGLKAHYQLEEMIGKKVLVVANLKSRKLVGFASHGMVLCACQYGEAADGSEDVVEFVIPHEDSNIGDRVLCEGYENNGVPATENAVIKKKMLKVIFPDLKINKDGIAVYKDQPLFTTTLSTSDDDNDNNDDGEDEEEVKKLPCRAMTLTNVPIS